MSQGVAVNSDQNQEYMLFCLIDTSILQVMKAINHGFYVVIRIIFSEIVRRLRISVEIDRGWPCTSTYGDKERKGRHLEK